MQRLRRTADLASDRGYRRPARRMLARVIQNHSNRALAHLGGKFVRRLARHGSILSGVGASGKPGAVHLNQPTLIALAYTIQHKRNAYYDALEHNNKSTEVTDWLVYFGKTVLEAQDNTNKRVEFSLAKTRFYGRLRGQLNERQEKAIARMFEEGIEGFKGGLSAENYITITKATRSTATRDLQDLVAKEALTRTGELRYTRYHLKLD